MSENQVSTVVKSSAFKQAALATIIGASLITGAHAEAVGSAALEVPDMTPIVTMISGMVAVVASVGMAVLSVYATAKVFKWVKAAF